MKKIQIYRLVIQSLFMLLAIGGLLFSFKLGLLILLALTIIGGPLYCGWICPYGFMQDVFSKLGRILCIKKIKMPSTIQKILVFARYAIFALVLGISSDLIFGLMSFDPRANFEKILTGNMIKTGAIVVIVFFALVALFFERPFCNYFCYEGAKYGLIGILRPFTIKRNTSACINCKKCDKVCPMNIKVSKCSNLRSLQCINCLECISACPSEAALSYGIIDFRKNRKTKYLAAASIALVLLLASFMLYKVYSSKMASNIDSPPPINNEQSTSKYLPEASNIQEEIQKEDKIETTPATDAEASKIKEEIQKQDKIEVTPDADVESDPSSNNSQRFTDGVYTGQGDGFRGPITVQVEVKNHEIVSVKVINSSDDMKWFNRANSVIPNEILEAQSTDVDVVSGATYSSRGIIDGVKDALD